MDNEEKVNSSISLKRMCGILITVLLALLPLAGLVYLLGLERFFRTFTVVLSGRIFSDSWNRIHVGFTLDQPTIGKWYFWFTVFTALSLPYMALVRRFYIRHSKLRHWIFVAGLTVLCLFLICLLTIPFFWMIQYIDTMGTTARRIEGLIYGIGGYASVLSFYVWAVRFSKIKNSTKKPVKISVIRGSFLNRQ